MSFAALASRPFFGWFALLAVGCGAESGQKHHRDSTSSSGGSGGSVSGAGGSVSSSSVGGTGGTSSGVGGSDSSSTGGSTTGGSGGDGSNGGSGGVVDLPPATGEPGKWENVTPSEMDPGLFTGSNGFGAGNVVTDPHRPTDLYVGGYGSTWKSEDYGLTWAEIPSNPVPPSQPLGHVLAVGGDGDVATLWVANVYGEQKVFRSTDAGLSFTLTGSLTGSDAMLYSIVVDPNDSTHLISGFHEQDGIAETTDSGDTWHTVGTSGWPSGGVSWFPFFIDKGDAAQTRDTWLAIAQNGGSVVITTNGGDSWTTPTGIAGLQHPHGNAGIYQDGATLFVGGMQGVGDGIYKSTDYGASFTKVGQYGVGVVWGTSKNLYAMWAWACASCTWDNPVQSLTAPQPGTEWTTATSEATNGLNWGPNSVAVTSDGEHSVFVGSMWASGLWRYVEP